MANNITLTKGPGGLGRPLPGQDFISGYLHYSSTLPSGFTPSRIQEVFSVAEAEALGIVTTFTMGSSSVPTDLDVMHYHISEYFRIQPKGDLFIGCYATSSDYAEITTMQNYASGNIRQIGVYTPVTFTTGMPTTIQIQLDLCNTNSKPLECILQPNFGTVSTTSLSSLTGLTAENVTVCVGQDGAQLGNLMLVNGQKTIGMVGVTLGAVSLAAVNESIAWVGKFNMDAGSELDTLAFAQGTLYSSLSDSAITTIDAKGYIFLKKFVGINGSYFNNSYTSIAMTSDYSRINNNRTINKAIRSLRTFLLPQLASPIKVNTDGTLSADVISYFETLCSRALDIMVSNNELSAFGATINPVQNILSTGKLTINVSLVPTGTADIITVNVGFVTSL